MKAHLDDLRAEVSTEYPHQDTAFFIYLDNHHIEFNENWRDEFQAFEESYVGHFESRTDFTYDYLDQTGLLDPKQYEGVSGAEYLIRYFDVDSFGRDLMNDYWETDGYYFRSY